VGLWAAVICAALSLQTSRILELELSHANIIYSLIFLIHDLYDYATL
jgi:hypothetical protein